MTKYFKFKRIKECQSKNIINDISYNLSYNLVGTSSRINNNSDIYPYPYTFCTKYM